MLKTGLLLAVIISSVIPTRFPFFLKLPNFVNSTNPTIKPCENFYAFSCTNWFHNAKRPSFEPIWNPWISAAHEINRKLSKLLHRQGPEILSKARNFHQICLKPKNYKTDLVRFIETLGGCPLVNEKWEQQNYDWLGHIGRITRILGIHPIVKIHVNLDYKNPTQYILYLEPGNLIFPRQILASPNRYNIELEAYKKWIFESFKYLYNSSHVIDDSLDEIIKFEMNLAKIMGAPAKNERITLWKLSNKWSKALNLIFSNITKMMMPNTTVIVKNCRYIKSLFILMEKTNPKVVANYLTWAVIKDLSRETSDHMRYLNFLIDQAVLGVQSDLNRELECVSKTSEYFTLALIPPYLNSYVNPKIFPIVNSMISSIKREFVKILTQNSWMSPEAKRLSIGKIKNIQINLGFPSRIVQGKSLEQNYENLEIGKNHFDNILKLKNFSTWRHFSKLGKPSSGPIWPSTPFSVNAYYSILQNSIFIPLGLLEPPFFQLGKSRFFNYGALGFLIGHELSHALDPVGILSNKNGKITKWWPDQDFAVYKNLSGCFKSDDSFNENIADYNGLKISLAASKSTPKTNKLFFISFAQMWCEISDDIDIFSGEEHAPVSSRVNNNLHHIKEFTDAYNCQLNSCELW